MTKDEMKDASCGIEAKNATKVSKTQYQQRFNSWAKQAKRSGSGGGGAPRAPRYLSLLHI